MATNQIRVCSRCNKPLNHANESRWSAVLCKDCAADIDEGSAAYEEPPVFSTSEFED